MGVMDDILRWLGLIGPQGAVVLDTVGEPVGDVEVQMLDPAGTVLDSTRTGADGAFTFSGGNSSPKILDLLIDPPELAVQIRLTNPTGPLHIFTVRRPVRLTETIGIEGTNAPIDLRRVQDRLVFVGRLTDADVTAEAIDTTAPPPDASTLPRLMAALYAHLNACGGACPDVIGPAGWELDLLNVVPDAPVLAGPAHALTGWVGDAPGQLAGAAGVHNAPADVRRVQDRLLQLGFLPLADYRAERINLAAAPNPVPEANIALTITAIRNFNEKSVGSFQHAIFAAQVQERRLHDPFIWGRLPLKIGHGVGSGGANRAKDVRALQDRLHELTLLSDADHAAERAALPAAGAADPPIAEAAIPRTIAAIQAAHVQLLGAAAPGAARLNLTDAALDRLNQPPPVDIFSVGDERPPISRAAVTNKMNHPRHVRAVQERLVLLGYLSDVAFALERANPLALESIKTVDLAGTLAAIRAVQGDLGIAVPGQLPVAGKELLLPAHRPTQILLGKAVGQGQPNEPRDVRPVQDRLHALRFLAAADYQAERVDPAAAALPHAIPRTEAAISAMRQRIFGLPAASADPWSAQPVIAPQSEALQFLNNPLFFGRSQIALTASVGELGYNRPEDLQVVQKRLNEAGLLSDGDLAAESPTAGRIGRMTDIELPQTIAALRTLRRSFLAENPDIGRIEGRNPLLIALDRPYEQTRVRLEIDGSVGTGGDNRVGDLAKVQRRLLELRRLDAAHFATESALLTAPLDLTQIPRTLAAIADWMTLNGVGAPPMTPFDVALRRLEWPVVPILDGFAINRPVGTGAGGPNRNRRDDVLLVQRRLHVLGYLATQDYLRERQVVSGLATVAGAQIPATIAAIELFQHSASGGTDGIISGGGNTERVLRDPAFGTPVPTNPDTANRDAGPGMPAQWHPNNARHREITAIILAIEAHEAGGSSGEVPAVLRNGSAVPASYGKAQAIVATAVGTLTNNAATADFYGLTAAKLAAITAMIGTADTEYGRIFGLVPAGGMTEANLVAAITADLAANAANFRAATGLGPNGHERMFRTAQLRRKGLAFIAAQPGPNDEAKRAAAVANVANFVVDPAVAPTVMMLGMTSGDVAKFLGRAIDNEHRGGFMMHVVFRMEDGLAVKSALTDDSGFKLGRFVIRDNFVHILNAGGAGLTRTQRAQITARIHNSGASGMAGFIANPGTAVNAYVNSVMAHWVDPGP